jgi:hypothetical protein
VGLLYSFLYEKNPAHLGFTNQAVSLASGYLHCGRGDLRQYRRLLDAVARLLWLRRIELDFISGVMGVYWRSAFAFHDLCSQPAALDCLSQGQGG